MQIQLQILNKRWTPKKNGQERNTEEDMDNWTWTIGWHRIRKRKHFVIIIVIKQPKEQETMNIGQRKQTTRVPTTANNNQKQLRHKKKKASTESKPEN